MFATDKSQSLLMIQSGYIKSKAKHKYFFNKKKNKWLIADEERYGSPSSKDADEELAEESDFLRTKKLFTTGYPPPLNRYRLVYENFNLSMEETYYWFLSHIRQDQGFAKVEKITDIFSAAENSAFFGQSAQRLSIQEDRASNFLRTIGQLVKELFQIIRELRIIDERLEAYNAWETKNKQGQIVRSKSADATLKGIFADFAENKGGQMQPGSLYHLAQTVGYASLPDLFYNTHIYKQEDVDKIIDKMDSFNPNVRNVLKRKLFQFLVWKDKTHDELNHRRKFMIRYLRQHWAIIKMYMAWTKPYLRHIKRLAMNEQQLDSPDLIGSFETSMTEVENIFIKSDSRFGEGMNSIILGTFQFTTRPVMQYRQDYQQGPVHVGRATVTLRSYAWTDKEVEKYKRYRAREDKNLLGLVDESVQSAMEELGDDMEKYLNESGEDIFDQDINDHYGASKNDGSKKKDKVVTGAAGSAFEPLGALFGGFKEIFGVFIPQISLKHKPVVKNTMNRKAAEDDAVGTMWQAYKNYKKAHKLLSW